MLDRNVSIRADDLFNNFTFSAAYSFHVVGLTLAIVAGLFNPGFLLLAGLIASELVTLIALSQWQNQEPAIDGTPSRQGGEEKIDRTGRQQLLPNHIRELEYLEGIARELEGNDIYQPAEGSKKITDVLLREYRRLAQEYFRRSRMLVFTHREILEHQIEELDELIESAQDRRSQGILQRRRGVTFMRLRHLKQTEDDLALLSHQIGTIVDAFELLAARQFSPLHLDNDEDETWDRALTLLETHDQALDELASFEQRDQQRSLDQP